ncbi:MAG: hypothetical protein ABW360_15545 [Phenylobacterium sp.]
MHWSRASRGTVLACGLLAGLALAGCGREKIHDISPELQAWRDANGRLASPTVLRLRDGACLDAARAPKPWVHILEAHQVNSLRIAASGVALGIAPYEVAGLKEDWFGQPFDGRVYVVVTGWSPPPYGQGYAVAAPSTIEAHIREGRWRRIDLWPGRSDLEAYEGAGRSYVDARRLTQCRDYGPDILLLRCRVISADGRLSYGVRLAASNIPDLPERLARITRAVEAMRAPCQPAS